MNTQKDNIFQEMYMGIHWILLLCLAIYHFQWEKNAYLPLTFLLTLYTLYLFFELFLFIKKDLIKLERLLGGYFQGAIDLFVYALVTLVYPDIFSISLPLLCLFILIFSFRNSKTFALLHGLFASLVYLMVALHLKHGRFENATLVFLSQSVSLLLFSLVISEVNHLFRGIFDRNRHAMDEIAYKNELLEKSVKTDFLTDMYNHQAFYQSLETISTKYVPIVLILFDIDNFKSINDRYGHVMGDYVIREVAQQIKKQLRSNDIAARYGGEEFAVLLPLATLTEGEQIAERIRLAIANHKFTLDEVTINVTVSGGVGMSTVTLSKRDQSLFVDQVDDLLYHSKRSGKNKITTSEHLAI